MFKKIVFPLSTFARNRTISAKSTCRSYSIYEPDYLDALKPPYPTYEALNFQIRGHDYPVLESYQKYLHRIAEAMEIDVSECWASPTQHLHIQRMKPNSSVVESDYNLQVYERTIQMCDVGAPIYPTILRIAQAALPEGVTLNVVEHADDLEEIRYVPDKDLLECKKMLDDMGGPKKK